MEKLKFIFLPIVFLLFINNYTAAQNWNLPESRSNDRFTEDYFDIPRPALSV